VPGGAFGTFLYTTTTHCITDGNMHLYTDQLNVHTVGSDITNKTSSKRQ